MKTMNSCRSPLSARFRRLPTHAYIHGVLDDLYDAVEAVHASRSLGFDPGDIHVMASWDYVEAVERSRKGQDRLARMLTRLLTFLDEGFGDVYLHEALRGRHILAVRLARRERREQVRDVLASHHTRLIKYVDMWTVSDLAPALSITWTLVGPA